jgi:hypothetical protein
VVVALAVILIVDDVLAGAVVAGVAHFVLDVTNLVEEVVLLVLTPGLVAHGVVVVRTEVVVTRAVVVHGLVVDVDLVVVGAGAVVVTRAELVVALVVELGLTGEGDVLLDLVLVRSRSQGVVLDFALLVVDFEVGATGVVVAFAVVVGLAVLTVVDDADDELVALVVDEVAAVLDGLLVELADVADVVVGEADDGVVCCAEVVVVGAADVVVEDVVDGAVMVGDVVVEPVVADVV